MSSRWGEIRLGIERLPTGRRKRELAAWYETTLRPSLEARVIDFDESCAMVWAGLRAREPNFKFVDSQIAATALAYGLVVVTRNVKDFAFPGLAVFNPWSK